MSDLVHRLREPEGPAEGALILNHGRGADENDLFPLLDYLDPDRRLLGVATGAPLTDIPPGGRHWYIVPRVGFPDHDTFHSSYGLLTGSTWRRRQATGCLPRRPTRPSNWWRVPSGRNANIRSCAGRT